MDERRFDQFTRGLATTTTRRRALKGLAAGAAGGMLSLFGVASAAADDDDKNKGKKTDCCPKQAPKLCGRICTDVETDTANCGKCGNACPAGSSCVKGKCKTTTPACTTPADCPQPTSPCQVATCTNGVCGFASAPAGTTCGPDACNGTNYTPASTCDGAGNCVAGTTISCDDGNVCTTNTCQPGVGCVQANAPAGTQCRAGSCNGGSYTQPSFCDGLGNCPAGETVSCDDGNPCTTHTCDPLTGCRQQGPAPNGTPCPNGTCQNGVCSTCTPGAPCNTGQLGPCAAGIIQCAGGQSICVSTYTPQPETCNGIDDDCDGFVDEGGDFLCPECQICAGGACVTAPQNSPCDTGACCNGTCTNTFDDVQNCGACNRRCLCNPTTHVPVCDFGNCVCDPI